MKQHSEYEGQAGALNESFSDVFGSLVKQYSLKQKAEKADWLIGSGLFTRKVKGVALRSMKEPGTAYNDPTIGKDPQPGHMKDYDNTTSDNGGVHINSGIPNRAFYLTAIELGGYAWEKAGKIWYIALTERLRERSNFQQGANNTYEVASTLFGKGSREQNVVENAWQKVGIKVKNMK
jgi:Zn-dependent metalloprotease